MDPEDGTGPTSPARGRLVDVPLAHVAATFDERADRYDDDAFHRWLSARVSDRVTPSAGRVLDVGAGTGAASSRMASTAPVVLLDVSLGMLGAARRRRPSTSPVCGDAHHLPFAGSVFDAVLCVATDSFLDLHVFVREASRVLRPGGRLTMTLWVDPPRETDDVVATATDIFGECGLALEAVEAVEWPDDEAPDRRRCVIVEARSRGVSQQE
jgi:ubiquinone/menaquinone biosynthesis C-methylase UbiE